MSVTSETVNEDLVSIEIDGRPLKVRRGKMVIEAADDADIVIPRFCYHKKLSVAANCRMCLVEVEKVPKPLPACATPVTEGMKVFTSSPKAIEAQKGIMEFLLINHPLDCPICDQGGECDLQELSIGYGSSESSFGENKRVVKDKDIGPLISTEMTRCIHCTRCVRFGEEIAGIRELGATGRGENMRIGTYVEKAVSSEMSGNIIDLCPVGALTSKPFRFTARAWEMDEKSSIAPHDCIGSNINVRVRGHEVMRVDPRENEDINEVWISDRDRFSYEALNSGERLQTPRIKNDGVWQDADWNTALEFVVNGINKTIETHGSSQIGGLISPSATLEEMYLAQKLLRGLGSHNIDHRLRQTDFNGQEHAPIAPWLGQAIADLENVDAAFLVGSNVRKEQPIAAHRLRKASLEGARIMFLNHKEYEFNFDVTANIATTTAGMEKSLAGIAKSVLDKTSASVSDDLGNLLREVVTEQIHQDVAEQLIASKKGTIILGNLAAMHPRFSTLRSLAEIIARHAEVSLGYLTDGANSLGACLAGVVPHRVTGGTALENHGVHARGMFDNGLKGYILHNIEPEFDCAQPDTAIKALTEAEFVVSLSPFSSNKMESYADVVLPVTPFTETSGTFVNIEGQWQSFEAVVPPLGEVRPAWKVLRVLGNFFKLDNFEYISTEEIRDEITETVFGLKPSNESQWVCPERLSSDEDGLPDIHDVPIYAVDNIVRRAAALQQTEDARIV